VDPMMSQAGVVPVSVLRLDPDRVWAGAAVREPGRWHTVAVERVAHGGGIAVARVDRTIDTTACEVAEAPAVG
jgi:hypothetical protein